MLKQLKSGMNTGLIIGEPNPEDYIAGINSPVPFKVRVKDGQWGEYIYDLETQKEGSLELMNCVTNSAINLIQLQLHLMISNGELDEAHILFLKDKGYMDSAGHIQISKRFTAKMSGTTKQGNTCQNVGNSLRHDGLVPEKVWPWEYAKQDEWNEYYSEIPQDVKELGQEFLKWFEIFYEKVPFSEVTKQMQQAPLQFGIPICPGYSEGGVVQKCSLEPAHAVMNYGYERSYDWAELDSYSPFLKKLAWNYPIAFAYKYLVNPSDPEVKKNLSLISQILMQISLTVAKLWQSLQKGLGSLRK